LDDHSRCNSPAIQTGNVPALQEQRSEAWEPLDHVLHTLNGTGMWEMQDFFNVDYETGAPSSKWVLKVGLIDEWHDYYTIGTYDKVAQRFIPDFLELDCGVGSTNTFSNE